VQPYVDAAMQAGQNNKPEEQKRNAKICLGLDPKNVVCQRELDAAQLKLSGGR
jgi:hypothetical protein